MILQSFILIELQEEHTTRSCLGRTLSSRGRGERILWWHILNARDFEAESTFLSRPAICGYCLIPRPQRSPALYKLLGDTMVLYCPFKGAQVPHIAEGTVRENIVFGAPFDEVHVFVVIVTSPWWWGVHLLMMTMTCGRLATGRQSLHQDWRVIWSCSQVRSWKSGGLRPFSLRSLNYCKTLCSYVWMFNFASISLLHSKRWGA